MPAVFAIFLSNLQFGLYNSQQIWYIAGIWPQIIANTTSHHNAKSSPSPIFYFKHFENWSELSISIVCCRHLASFSGNNCRIMLICCKALLFMFLSSTSCDHLSMLVLHQSFKFFERWSPYIVFQFPCKHFYYKSQLL